MAPVKFFFKCSPIRKIFHIKNLNLTFVYNYKKATNFQLKNAYKNIWLLKRNRKEFYFE